MSKVNKEPSEPPAAPKPKFKKLKTKNKARRLRTRDNPNDDDNEEDSSAMEAIEQTKKKRKLLNQVLYKKGLDATATLKPSLEVADVVKIKADDSTDATERMRAFAGEGGDATAEGGVLQRKHASAMEEFIQENLKAEVVEEETSTRKNSGTDDLFAELASASQKLAGIASVAATVGEGDVGAGGAMLGGTGIAEVTLPADDRIQTIRETQEAVSSFPAENNRSSAVPQDSLDDSSEKNHVSNVPSSYSHNFQLHTQERAQQNKQQDNKAETATAPAIEQNEGPQDERMGFEAARRSAKGDSAASVGTSQGKKRSNDDRVWKNFVTREREGRS